MEDRRKRVGDGYVKKFEALLQEEQDKAFSKNNTLRKTITRVKMGPDDENNEQLQ